MRTIELYVSYFTPTLPAQPFIRYEWFGLKGQKKELESMSILEMKNEKASLFL